MRVPLPAVFAIVFSSACTQSSVSPAQPGSLSIPVRLQSEPRAAVGTASPQRAAALDNLRTHLHGDEEVPARETNAQGQAIFHINEDATAISYKLIVANIENVTQAHIHLAPAGSNGGIVVWLYPAAPPSQLIPGRTQGTLGEGEITAASLRGSLTGKPLSDLIDKLQDGGAYVNVHTLQFPGGEVRGQID